MYTPWRVEKMAISFGRKLKLRLFAVYMNEIASQFNRGGNFLPSGTTPMDVRRKLVPDV